MIWSMDQLRDFVNNLPDLKEGQCYLLLLSLRSRYVKEKFGIKLPDTVLEREIVYWYYDDWRDVFIRKVKKLATLGEHAEDIYVIRKGGTEYIVTKDVLGIFAVINPSDVRKALADLSNEIISSALITGDLKYIANIKKRWFGCLHRRTRTIFHTIDIDDKFLFDSVLSKLRKYTHPYMIIETPRGFHFIVHIPSLGEKAKDYFEYFVSCDLDDLRRRFSKDKIEYLKQGLEPVPGTLYGGHEVWLIAP